ncbi:hypothetical protein [Ferrovibrio sp.]|uniref:hypothetical protein n=1 Tax=Ferrovibrio sp. TaxID=1917215 RepID=UPI003D2DA03D
MGADPAMTVKFCTPPGDTGSAVAGAGAGCRAMGAPPAITPGVVAVAGGWYAPAPPLLVLTVLASGSGAFSQAARPRPTANTAANAAATLCSMCMRTSLV